MESPFVVHLQGRTLPVIVEKHLVFRIQLLLHLLNTIFEVRSRLSSRIKSYSLELLILSLHVLDHAIALL